MKKTLLEIVQDILSDMGGDEVNSINDTFESSQVAQVVRSTYEAMMANRNWPHQKRMIKLTASGDLNFPTHMSLEDEVKEVISIEYDCARAGDTKKKYKTINYLTPEDFLRYVYKRDDSATNVQTVTDVSGSELFIRNDLPPTYYTSFDDTTVIFDSYDSAVDNTLQQTKVQAIGYVLPGWVHADNHVPDLPAEAFPALLEESKSKSFIKIAQRPDQHSTIEARRQQTWLSRKAWRVAGGIQYPSYGRRNQKTIKNPTFRNDV